MLVITYRRIRAVPSSGREKDFVDTMYQNSLFHSILVADYWKIEILQPLQDPKIYSKSDRRKFAETVPPRACAQGTRLSSLQFS